VQPDRPSVLCLLPTVPVAANTGGALRALGVLRALDKAFRVTVVARRRENEEGSVLAGLLQGSVHLLPHPTGVAALLKETSGVVTGLPAGYCRYGGFSPVLKQLLETQRFDFVHFDHPHAASAWPQIKRLQPRALLVLDAHNVEAEIVEQLAESAPQWLIVGRNPPSHVRALASNDVVVEGDVASVRPHLDRAFATAIPLRVGSGTRIKILEAWAAGVPVVASGIAAEGLPHSDGVDLILAERPSEFARALVRLWRDRRFADNLAREGARTVEPFTVEKIGEAVENDYRELLAIQGRPMQRMDANKF
jgi:glycosyl transferase family 1